MPGFEDFKSPLPFQRSVADFPPLQRSWGEEENDDEERLLRYLQYDCNYRHSHYPGKTWGEILILDYEHFKALLCIHVPREGKTYAALRKALKDEDKEFADTCIRVQEQEQDKFTRFMGYTCGHQGRMNKKTWLQILAKDYDYFLWAVANTMGRESTTFNVLIQALKPEDQAMVLKLEKGKYVSSKKKGGEEIQKRAQALLRHQSMKA
jgi:hypothetical protein